MPGVRRSPSPVFFFLRVDNPTVRMFILLLLFVLTSFLLLALDDVTLSQIVVLVFNHISMFHVVDLFLIVRINLCIAKLLLFPTVTLEIRDCANLVTLPNLPPSLDYLCICGCGKLCSVSGQLGGLERLHIINCNKLQSVHSIEDASSLETLFLSSCQCLASLGSSSGGEYEILSSRSS
jgi:hypothetical protein